MENIAVVDMWNNEAWARELMVWIKMRRKCFREELKLIERRGSSKKEVPLVTVKFADGWNDGIINWNEEQKKREDFRWKMMSSIVAKIDLNFQRTGEGGIHQIHRNMVLEFRRRVRTEDLIGCLHKHKSLINVLLKENTMKV